METHFQSQNRIKRSTIFNRWNSMVSRFFSTVLNRVAGHVLWPAWLGLLIPFTIAGYSLQCPDNCLPGRYSTEAVQVDFGQDGYAAAHPIYTPDHKKALRINKNHLWLEVSEKQISTPVNPTDWSWAEIGWAPDSRTFFISHSVGYTTGYRVDVWRIEGERARRLANLNHVVQRDFERRHICYDPDYKTGNDPNIAGLKWIGNSDELLVVAEVPNVGICKQHYFAGYLVSAASGRIIERFNPQALLRGWPSVLGENLLSDLHYMSNQEASSAP
jgi:hypothetical protein